MFVTIGQGRVAQATGEIPVLEQGECALIVGFRLEVHVGWLWKPEGCKKPPVLAPVFVCGVNVWPVCEKPIVTVALPTGEAKACQCERG